VPESPTAKVEFEALLTTARLPVAAPLVCGANARLKLVLCPAARVRGKLIPLRLNPEPVAAACVMVTLDPPEFVRVSDAAWLLPVWTLPKLTLDGLAVSDPAATEVPASAVFTVALEALLEIAIFPDALPADCGENTTVKLVLCPAGIVNGKLKPVMLNPGPVGVTWLTVTLEPPVLVRVSGKPCDLPMGVLLKLMLAVAIS
jgi:hypothetical protein